MATLKYPLQAVNGSLTLNNDPERQSIEAVIGVLNTREEERVMNPGFGTEWLEFRALNDLPGLVRRLEVSLNNSLSEYPDFDYRITATIDDSGVLEVNVYYFYQGEDESFTVRL